ncbi:membrane protein [Mycolicibacterium madagascariense]|uniref:Membrane protein n=1 Tax=Mycolicibacterium madagascariense TaxID=212765 RepID=A0A7I7XL98_9MYCO|nr:DUF2752 domain-containing protein [Mycolicibacterium madagascariense]MCV7012333.1 DUF2752 domain-containing protein [Mycolicibacterium madagascariense]BBZ30008.1 membrane protein [Mycolicibacterium madagascariense]
MLQTRRTPALASLGAPLGVVAAAGLGCGAIWLGDPLSAGGPLPVCPTKALLGIDCPGCGSLRMIYCLLHGDAAGAIRYNALGLVAVLFLLWAFGAWTYGRLVGRRIASWQHYRWSAAVALVLVLAWFVVRNLPFAPFTVLYV